MQQSRGYRAFVPTPLPPDPPVACDGGLLPNPDLFVAMYVRHEAVLSSQIKGTQSALEDVLALRGRRCAR